LNSRVLSEAGQLDAAILMLGMSWRGGHLDAKMLY